MPVPTQAPAVCKCGERRYASAEEAHRAEPHGEFKCPTCHTFAHDHGYRDSGDGEGRCSECDTRWYSHGGPR